MKYDFSKTVNHSRASAYNGDKTERRKENAMKHCCSFNVCEVATIAMPAFGAGVLLTMLMPPCILCGVCGVILLGAGISCLILK